MEISLLRDVSIKVGALGEIHFKKGSYVYVGSAQRNLEKRVERHFRKEKKLFWHIDYLLSDEWAKIDKVSFRPEGKFAECAVAQHLMKLGIPVLGFGCSDCRCKSHFFWFPKNFPSTEREIFPDSRV